MFDIVLAVSAILPFGLLLPLVQTADLVARQDILGKEVEVSATAVILYNHVNSTYLASSYSSLWKRRSESVPEVVLTDSTVAHSHIDVPNLMTSGGVLGCSWAALSIVRNTASISTR